MVGLKPTYGAVSRYGLMAAASSLDQIGTIARTVEDAHILLEAIQGYDASDSTSLKKDFYPARTTKKVIGVPRAFLQSGIDPDVLARFEIMLTTARMKGYEVRDVEIPTLAYSLAVYYIINPAEVSTNLDRYDGIRYGLSVPQDTISEVYSASRGEGFGPETRRRIIMGTFVLSAGYADAYYRKARAVRELIREDLRRTFEDVDVIALPTSPTPAWKIGEKADPVTLYAADICTVPVNLAGVPAISIPMGTVNRNEILLPVGFQLVGAHGDERGLCEIAKELEIA